jgi:hypothetical protein
MTYLLCADAVRVMYAPTRNAIALVTTNQAGKTQNPIVIGRLAVTSSPSHSATTDITFRGRQAPPKPEVKRVLPSKKERQIPSLLTMKWMEVARKDEGVLNVW